jgi:hypothetical protein
MMATLLLPTTLNAREHTMDDSSNFEETPPRPSGPWPSEAEIELERRLISLEAGQNRTNQLLMQLQLEYRQGVNQLGTKVDELAGLMKKFLSNGDGD